MKLIKGEVKEDMRRDVFWQKSFVEDEQGELIFRIIICASQEFISVNIKKDVVSVQIDEDMKKWFYEKTEQLYAKALSAHTLKETETLFDLYPQTRGMLEFVRTI